MECHGDTHVYLVNQPYCQCGGQIASWDTEIAAWDAMSDEALFNFENYCAATDQNYPASGAQIAAPPAAYVRPYWL